MTRELKSVQYLSILLRWKRFIIINTIIAAIISVGVSLVLPNWYKATTSLLTPKQPDLLSSIGGASSVLKGISGLGKLGGFGQKSGSYNYFAILKSRSTLESVVQKFDLVTVYDVKDRSLELTIKELSDNVRFEDGEDDDIIIEVLDKDPDRAAAMANYFVEVLNDVNTRIGTQEARINREFLENRLAEAYKLLYDSEEKLRQYQEKSGLIITPEQTSGLDAVATLYAMKVKKEIEASILERSVTGENAQLQQTRLELDELEKKVATIPQTGIASIRLYRDVAIQQKIVEFLVPVYEQARIEEQKDVPVLLILDKAVRPEKKTKPQRALIVLLVTSLVFFISIGMTFMMTVIMKTTPDDAEGVSRSLVLMIRRITGAYRMNRHGEM